MHERPRLRRRRLAIGLPAVVWSHRPGSRSGSTALNGPAVVRFHRRSGWPPQPVDSGSSAFAPKRAQRERCHTPVCRRWSTVCRCLAFRGPTAAGARGSMTGADPPIPAARSADPGREPRGVVRALRPGAMAVSAPSVADPERSIARGIEGDGISLRCAAIVARDAELAGIDEFLASAAVGACALILSGEAGIGKTALWESAIAQARILGHRVLTHRSVPAEAGLAFTALGDLFGAA